jgi:hypothetical protein
VVHPPLRSDDQPGDSLWGAIALVIRARPADLQGPSPDVPSRPFPTGPDEQSLGETNRAT